MLGSARNYRAATIEGTSHLGLLLATYDVLAEDLRLAGVAAAAGNIAERCRLSGHAVLLLGHLESWVPLLEDSVLETGLIRFYAFIRSEIMRLQTTSTSDGFSDLAMQVGETRAAWQQKGSDLRAVRGPEPLPMAVLQGDTVESSAELRHSWSA